MARACHRPPTPNSRRGPGSRLELRIRAGSGERLTFRPSLHAGDAERPLLGRGDELLPPEKIQKHMPFPRSPIAPFDAKPHAPVLECWDVAPTLNWS
jgi:hypothetical protein